MSNYHFYESRHVHLLWYFGPNIGGVPKRKETPNKGTASYLVGLTLVWTARVTNPLHSLLPNPFTNFSFDLTPLFQFFRVYIKLSADAAIYSSWRREYAFQMTVALLAFKNVPYYWKSTNINFTTPTNIRHHQPRSSVWSISFHTSGHAIVIFTHFCHV